MKSSLIIGLVFGFALILIVIVSKGDIEVFLNWSAFAITVGGTFAAILVYFSYTDINHGIKAFGDILFEKDHSPEEIIDILAEVNTDAHINGINNISSIESIQKHPYLLKGLTLVADNTDPSFIREILIRENRAVTRKHNIAENVFYMAGSLCPMFGMTGTVIGLVAMLNRIQDPTAIPAAMGLALVTTLYGLILASLVFKPISGKIRVRNLRNTRLRLLILEGILSIQKGENNQILRERLFGFLD